MTFGYLETAIILLLALGAIAAFVYARRLERKAREQRLNHPW